MINAIEKNQSISNRSIIGIYGQEFDSSLKNHLNKLKPAGIIIFTRNAISYKQLKDFISRIKDHLSDLIGFTPYICIDHEGGRINRLPFLEKLDSASDIGKLEKETEIISWIERLNEQLLDLGFNLNFAPCIDIFTNSNNKCLEGRCFSDDSEKVSRLTGIYIKKTKSMGLLTCAKHYPGLGSAGRDTHDEKALIDRSEEELFTEELIPFKIAIKERVDFIMINHAIYPKIDHLPASLSPKLIKSMLREKLNFEGKIITDDLCMKGITNYFSKEECIQKAIDAGNDLLLVCH